MITVFKPSPEAQLSKYIYKTTIEGLFYLEPNRFEDSRGSYSELAHIPEIESTLQLSFPVKQLNVSHSLQNVIRGFHAENWNKLATVMTGSCFCAWVDLRPSSPSFKEVVTMNLGQNESDLKGSIFITKGIGNSFCVTQGPVDYVYAVDELYSQRDTTGDIAISLFDPELAVPWPLAPEEMILSQRDQQAISIAEKFSET